MLEGELWTVRVTHLAALPLPGSALGALLPYSVVARDRTHNLVAREG
jgi:hypothetical protein